MSLLSPTARVRCIFRAPHALWTCIRSRRCGTRRRRPEFCVPVPGVVWSASARAWLRDYLRAGLTSKLKPFRLASFHADAALDGLLWTL
jgi:hypothetical protein